MTQLKLEIHQGSQEEPKTEAQRNVSVPQPQPEPTPAPSTPRTAPAPGWQTGLKRCFSTVAAPLSSLAELGGLHGFAPLPLDKEFAKAAGILEKFTTTDPSNPTLETIPPSVLQSAAGLIILTTGRLGLRRLSFSSGSGVLLVRQHDGGYPEVSSPSSITTTKESNIINNNSNNNEKTDISHDKPNTNSASDDDSKNNNKQKKNPWSPPQAITTQGLGAGPFALGFQVTQRVYVVPSQEALELLLSGDSKPTTNNNNQGEGQGILLGPEATYALGRDASGGRGRGVGVLFPLSFLPRSWGKSHGGYRHEKKTGMKERGDHHHHCCCCGEKCEKHDPNDTNNNEEKKKNNNNTNQERNKIRSSLNNPVQSYIRSSGLYLGLQAEASVITPRMEENAAFYSPHRYDHNHDYSPNYIPDYTPNYTPNISGDDKQQQQQQQAGIDISIASLPQQHHKNDASSASAAVKMVMDVLARAEEGP